MSVSSRIDAANKSFWDELCGTQLAQSLGVTDDSAESLKRFDDWYFEFYPVVLVVFDAERSRAFWLHVQDYIDRKPTILESEPHPFR